MFERGVILAKPNSCKSMVVSNSGTWIKVDTGKLATRNLNGGRSFLPYPKMLAVGHQSAFLSKRVINQPIGQSILDIHFTTVLLLILNDIQNSTFMYF